MTTDEIMELALLFRNAEYYDASQQASFDLKTAIEALQADAARWQDRACRLWALLDDIDTQDDASKGDDDHFRRCCYTIQRKRFSLMSGEMWDAAMAQDKP